jgi:hypothetical protein
MKKIDHVISIETARLVIGYLHNSLNESEKDLLDKWVSHSDENMENFCKLTENVDENVFDPNELIIETENAIDLWIIAGLIVRHQQGINGELEERCLEEWINVNEQNKMLYTKLQHSAFMQKMLVWNRLKREQMS